MNLFKSLFNRIKADLKGNCDKANVRSLVLKFLPSVLILISYLSLIITTRGFSASHISIMSCVLLFSILVPFIKVIASKKIVKILSALVFTVAPYIVFLTVEALVNNKFGKTPWHFHILIMNLAFYYLLELLIFTFTTRTDIAITVTAIIPTALGVANYVCLQTRDLPLYPWDILSFGTAFSVADNYDLHFSPVFKLSIFCIFSVILIGISLNLRLKFKKLWVGLIPAVAATVLMSGYVANINSIFKTEENALKNGYYPYLFSASYLYKYNGTPVTFIYTLKYLNLTAPKGYSIDELKALYDEYKEQSEADAVNKKDNVKPNIIIIMNEAFSDPSTLGKFQANEPYLPYIDSLKSSDRVVMGSTVVSVKGGNTANSEFEFLTGTSMAFLPTESIPYQQFISGNVYSIVSQLNEFGYKTVGMHNYYKAGWERDQIYKYLQFDESYFLEDMSPLDPDEMIRSYMSDKALFERIIAMHEDKEENEPLFVFGVTMQNHGGYDDKKNNGFIPSIKVELEGSETETDENDSKTMYLNNYLSLLKESDKAFEYLTEYFSSVSEPTIIVMFGDHQPADNVVNPLLESNGITIDNTDPSQRITRYHTPYIVWSNYDVEGVEDLPETISLNYFGGQIMDLCGLPLTPFQIWQKDLIKKFPVINAFCYVDESGTYNSIAGIESIEGINMLGRLQYNLIFDTKNTVSELFKSAVK